ncbi:MAG TPA: hypothetical protein VFF04_03145 [Candidatus Babeliales bacterium]|nr:hypothetical protein [Candidatus Babeliales bacterium]
MDYNSMSLLMYQLRKQQDKQGYERVQQEFNKLMEQFNALDPEQLYETYKNNMSFAVKMSQISEEAGGHLYSKGMMEKDSALMQEFIGRCFTVATDSVIWDTIADELSLLIDQAEEAMPDDEEMEEGEEE